LIDLGILGLPFDGDGFGLRPGVLRQLLFVVGLVLLQRHQLLFQLRVLSESENTQQAKCDNRQLVDFYVMSWLFQLKFPDSVQVNNYESSQRQSSCIRMRLQQQSFRNVY